ncbi:hypothetical protein [Paucilactobacillus kaifaensis]|uniref:hypothetical protein n=1 Tax=Paucilactobacillus kaifaensis TaxID=2559921 RepID=UPI0010F4ED0F|nr:hypothetical protein [Paucilactobacillus kaifaensis]
MKKLVALILVLSVTIGLIACGNQETDNQSNSSSSDYSSKSSSSANNKSIQSVRLGADDSTNLLSSQWEFDNFTVNQIKAEAEDGVLELEVDWQNTTNRAVVFNDTAKITVSQNNNEINVDQQDDDYNDNVLPNKTEDFEFDYQYDGIEQPIKISIHPADTNRPTRTVIVQLQN